MNGKKKIYVFERFEFRKSGAGVILYFSRDLPIPATIHTILNALREIFRNEASYPAEKILGKEEGVIITLWWKDGTDLSKEDANAISIEDHNDQTLKIELDEEDANKFEQIFKESAKKDIDGWWIGPL
jgi:hypothetical protein